MVECTPEMRRVELQSGDSAVVLASDGLWDVLSDSDAVGVLTRVRGSAPCLENLWNRLIAPNGDFAC